MVKCPVCFSEYEKETRICTTCRFTELNKVFASREDYQDWMAKVVEPVRKMYQEEIKIKQQLHQQKNLDEKTILLSTRRFSFIGDSKNKWENIVSIAQGQYHIVGLRKDGTVVAAGGNKNGACNVENWKDIILVACGEYHTVGLKKNGTVIAAGRNKDGECNVENWKDIISVSCGKYHTVGLRKDGTVVATGRNKYGACNVGHWQNVQFVFCGEQVTIGVKAEDN